MVLEIHIEVCVTEPDFPEKKFFAPKIAEKDQK